MRLLLAPEVAELLRVSKNRVYEMAKRKLIPCVYVGRHIRFLQEKVLAWIEAGGSSLETPPLPIITFRPPF